MIESIPRYIVYDTYEGISTDDMRSIVYDIYEGKSIDYASRYMDR
jgi:hypothetical protein